MPPIRAPGMVKGVASVRSGALTAGSKKPGTRKLAHFNHLEEGGNRLDGKEVSKSRLAYLSGKRAELQKEGKDLSKKEREELGTFRKQAGCDSASEIRARAALKRENEQRIAKGLKPLPIDGQLSPHPSDSEMDELDEDSNDEEEEDDDEDEARDSDAPVKASAARLPVNPIKKQQQLEHARLKRQAARRAAGKKERKAKSKGKGKRMRAEVSDDSDVAEERERKKKKKASSSSSKKSSSSKSNSRNVLNAMDSDSNDEEEENRRPRPKKKTRTLVKKKDVPKSGWRSIYDDDEQEEPLFAQPIDEEMEVEDDEEHPTWAHEEAEESDATRRRRVKGKGRAEKVERESDDEFDEIVETEEEEEEEQTEETNLFDQLEAPVRARLGIDPSYSSFKKVAPSDTTSTAQPQKKPVVDSDSDEDDDTQHTSNSHSHHSPSRSSSQDVIELSDSEEEDDDLPTVDKAISKIPRAKHSTKSNSKPEPKSMTSPTSVSTSKKSKPAPIASSSASSFKSKPKPPTPLSPSKLSTSYASISYDRDPTSKRALKPSAVNDDEDDPFPLRLGKAIKTPKASIARPSAEGPHKLGGGGGVKIGKPAGLSTLEMEERIREKKLLEGRPRVVGRGGGGGLEERDVAQRSAPVRQPSNTNTNAVAGSSLQQPQKSQAGPSQPRSSLPTSSTSPSTSVSSNSSNGPKTPTSPRKPPPPATGPRFWSCSSCTLDNEVYFAECQACETPRAPAEEMFAGGWTCRDCGRMNEPDMWHCFATSGCEGKKRAGQ